MKKIFLPLLVLLCLILPAQAAGFYDLPSSHWAGPDIQRALDAGVMNGYGDGSFQPSRDVTAAQFCTMLCRSFLAEEYAAAPEGKYQAMDACLPVLTGTSAEETYRDLGKRWDRYVNTALSRYDMAQMIYNLVLAKDALQETIHLSTTDIADWADIPDGYHSAVFTCWGMGLLKGQADGRFAGEDSLNRAQAAVIWSRLDTLFNGPAEAPKAPGGEAEGKDMPAFGLQGEETVQEMMDRVNRATPAVRRAASPTASSGARRTSWSF